MSTFGILVGGGPASGINGVIGAAVDYASRRGARVLGILDGFRWLMEGDATRVIQLGPDQVAGIHLRGGSILHTSRANPTKRPESLEAVVGALDALKIEYLITIGGDDTAFSARRVAEAAGGRIHVAHVPKTIDNDLPLPTGVPTFGFETARERAASVLEALLADTQTTQRWYIAVVMGRTAGHLALGAAKSAGATIALIPEEFSSQPIRLEDVVRTLEGSIVKRLAQGRPDGVAVIAEGIAEHLDPDDPILSEIPRDEHGHLRLADVPLGRVLRNTLQSILKERGVPVTLGGEKDVGYELRSGPPSAFDRDYTRDLGVGAVRALLDGHSSVMITRQAGAIVPVAFDDLVDPETGRTRVRQVDVATDTYLAARALQVRVEADDLSDPKRLAALAAAARLSEPEVKMRYAPL